MMSSIDFSAGAGLSTDLEADGPLAAGTGYAYADVPLAMGTGYAYAGIGTLGLGGPLARGGAGPRAALGPGGAGARGGARPPAGPDGY